MKIDSLSALVSGGATGLGAAVAPAEFHESDYSGRHPDWERRAEPAIRRVAAVWDGAGLRFPLEELMEKR